MLRFLSHYEWKWVASPSSRSNRRPTTSAAVLRAKWGSQHRLGSKSRHLCCIHISSHTIYLHICHHMSSYLFYAFVLLFKGASFDQRGLKKNKFMFWWDLNKHTSTSLKHPKPLATGKLFQFIFCGFQPNIIVHWPKAPCSCLSAKPKGTQLSRTLGAPGA